LQAVVTADHLPLAGGLGALRLGLAAVLEEGDGKLSYWALRHPAAVPDFHHRGGFTAKLPS
jgi:hypothetical protein